MPITDDIRKHPLFKRGEEKGLGEGIEKGVEQRERKVLRKLIEKRFGSLPVSLDQRLNELTPECASARSGRA